jgi:hypothetical protein
MAPCVSDIFAQPDDAATPLTEEEKRDLKLSYIAPASLRSRSFAPLSSSPDLFRRSTCSSATKEHVDARDKPAHDGGGSGSSKR